MHENAHVEVPQLHADDLRLVQEVLSTTPSSRDRFEQRIECVRRMVHARNNQLGRPLNSEELPDIVQDTLAIIWRKLPEFEGRSSLETWMYRICSLELMNAVRSKKRNIQKRVQDSDLELEWHAAEAEELPLSLRFEKLYGCLERLSELDERIIRLKHYEDQTFEEIGDSLGLTPSGVKHHYYRAISRLRELMTARNPDSSK